MIDIKYLESDKSKGWPSLLSMNWSFINVLISTSWIFPLRKDL